MYSFIANVKANLPEYFINKTVLCPKNCYQYFDSGTFTFEPDTKYDVIMSVNAFEFDFHYKQTLLNMINSQLNASGLFILICASFQHNEYNTYQTGGEYDPNKPYQNY